MGPAAPMLVMVAIAAVSAGMQYAQAREQAGYQADAAVAQAEATNTNANLQYQEIDRQQRETNRVSQEQRSDRMMRARQELGTLRVLSGERGASANTSGALLREVGYWEGVDLGRIEANRKASVDAGEANKKAVYQNALNGFTDASLTAKAASKSVQWAGIGAGLQIASAAASSYSSYSMQQQELEAAKNKGVQ